MGDHFRIYSTGLCFVSVCTDLDDDAATRRINLEYPTGISSEWAIHDDTFADGTPNPAPCADDPTWRHVLFSC